MRTRHRLQKPGFTTTIVLDGVPMPITEFLRFEVVRVVTKPGEHISFLKGNGGYPILEKAHDDRSTAAEG